MPIAFFSSTVFLKNARSNISGKEQEALSTVAGCLVNASDPQIEAMFLNVGSSTIAQWEKGHRKPSGPSLRLLDVIDRKGVEALVCVIYPVSGHKARRLGRVGRPAKLGAFVKSAPVRPRRADLVAAPVVELVMRVVLPIGSKTSARLG